MRLGTQAAFDISGGLRLIIDHQATRLILAQNTIPFVYLSLILHISQANVIVDLPVEGVRQLIGHLRFSRGVSLQLFLPVRIRLNSLC